MSDDARSARSMSPPPTDCARAGRSARGGAGAPWSRMPTASTSWCPPPITRHLQMAAHEAWRPPRRPRLRVLRRRRRPSTPPRARSAALRSHDRCRHQVGHRAPLVGVEVLQPVPPGAGQLRRDLVPSRSAAATCVCASRRPRRGSLSSTSCAWLARLTARSAPPRLMAHVLRRRRPALVGIAAAASSFSYRKSPTPICGVISATRFSTPTAVVRTTRRRCTAGSTKIAVHVASCAAQAHVLHSRTPAANAQPTRTCKSFHFAGKTEPCPELALSFPGAVNR